MRDECAKCCHRWYGNYESPTFARWYCRVGNKYTPIDKVQKCHTPSRKTVGGTGKADAR